MATHSARAILLKEYGGADGLVVSTVDLPDLGPGEIRLRQTAIGINYHDVYVRSGLYRTLALPGVPGIEAVGLVEAIGEGVSGLEVGDRVGYVTGEYGSYADARNLKAEAALKLPSYLSDVQAAATLMKALTTCVLLRKVHRLRPGQTILVHAAAGGMGQLICRWAAGLGVRVIGSVGSVAKADIARGCGATEIILYRQEDIVARVEALTGGTGVDVVYDAVGADTFEASLKSLAFCGHLVNFGQASGPVAPVALSTLATRSLSLSRPIVFHYLRDASKLRAIAEETFAAFDAGMLRPIDPAIFPFEQAREAHLMLERAESPGGIVLLP
jgi:NADPH2:quinone reductase